ncbi:hypothetical protein pb186bvf_012533 [Paramecium bursaria]
MQKLLNAKNSVQLVWENNNLTDFIILIPDQQFKMLTRNEFNIYQIFKIGIGYPMNYKKCNHKIYTYLQLHKFGYKFNTFYDVDLDMNKISDRIRLHTKIQYQFDTDLIDYFKSVHDKLFIKSYLKLANLEYKKNMTDEVVSSYLNDYQQEIHSHIIYNAINIKQFIRDKCKNVIIYRQSMKISKKSYYQEMKLRQTIQYQILFRSQLALTQKQKT